MGIQSKEDKQKKVSIERRERGEPWVTSLDCRRKKRVEYERIIVGRIIANWGSSRELDIQDVLYLILR